MNIPLRLPAPVWQIVGILCALLTALTNGDIVAVGRFQQLVISTGAYRYEVLHHWAQLPEKYSWQTTHNVAIDREGLLYVIHEGPREFLHPHDACFDPAGNIFVAEWVHTGRIFRLRKVS